MRKYLLISGKKQFSSYRVTIRTMAKVSKLEVSLNLDWRLKSAPSDEIYHAMITGRSEQAEIADLDPLSDGKKRRISCQSPHLLKIQDIESISKPHLLAEIYTIWQNLSLNDFGK